MNTDKLLQTVKSSVLYKPFNIFGQNNNNNNTVFNIRLFNQNIGYFLAGTELYKVGLSSLYKIKIWKKSIYVAILHSLFQDTMNK